MKNILNARKSTLLSIRDEYFRKMADPSLQKHQLRETLVTKKEDGTLCYCAQGLLCEILRERGYARLRGTQTYAYVMGNPNGTPLHYIYTSTILDSHIAALIGIDPDKYELVPYWNDTVHWKFKTIGKNLEKHLIEPGQAKYRRIYPAKYRTI